MKINSWIKKLILIFGASFILILIPAVLSNPISSQKAESNLKIINSSVVLADEKITPEEAKMRIRNVIDPNVNPNFDSSAVVKVWRFMRSLINTALVVILLLAAFANILHINIDTYAIKKVLPAMVLGVILANFSLLICRMFLDIGDVLAVTFLGEDITNYAAATKAIITQVKEALGLAGVAPAAEGALENIWKTLSVSFGVIIGVGVAAAAFGSGWFVLLLAFLFILLPSVIILFLGLLFYARVGVLYFLIMISPVAFFLLAFPFTQQWFKKWWSVWLNWVFMLPVVFLLLKIAAISGGAGGIFGWIIAIAMLIMACTVPFKLGGAVGTMVAGLQGLATGLMRRGAGYAGREIGKDVKAQYQQHVLQPAIEGKLKGLGKVAAPIGHFARRGLHRRLEHKIGQEAVERGAMAYMAKRSQGLLENDKGYHEKIQEELEAEQKTLQDRKDAGETLSQEEEERLRMLPADIKQIQSNIAKASTRISAIKRTRLQAEVDVYQAKEEAPIKALSPHETMKTLGEAMKLKKGQTISDFENWQKGAAGILDDDKRMDLDIAVEALKLLIQKRVGSPENIAALKMVRTLGLVEATDEDLTDFKQVRRKLVPQIMEQFKMGRRPHQRGDVPYHKVSVPPSREPGEPIASRPSGNISSVSPGVKIHVDPNITHDDLSDIAQEFQGHINGIEREIEEHLRKVSDEIHIDLPVDLTGKIDIGTTNPQIKDEEVVKTFVNKVKTQLEDSGKSMDTGTEATLREFARKRVKKLRIVKSVHTASQNAIYEKELQQHVAVFAEKLGGAVKGGKEKVKETIHKNEEDIEDIEELMEE